MSRVLIWKRVFPGSEYDIFNPTDYDHLWEHVQSEWGGIRQNWGNKLWFQGIYSAIDTGENEYGFIGRTIDEEQINNEYDFIVLPMANIFYKDFLSMMQELTLHLEKIRIPVFVIVCGVQADSYDDLDDLILAIGEDSKRFIRAVYKTGGEFALRGFFTKEFFDRLGFHSAVVTGCPSIYQLGPDFTMEYTKVDESRLKPVFNGHGQSFAELMNAFPSSVFIDQDEYFEPLFNPEYLSQPSLKFKLNFINSYGIESAKFLAKGRICTFADMNDWWNFLQNQKFNYSFGSRIHGTIMAILSGVPATIIAHDSRTREMAEFFDIPMLTSSPRHLTSRFLLDAYEKMDYSAFNANFAQRFATYEHFLTSHGIVSHANVNNHFFTRVADISFGSIYHSNKSDFESLSSNLSENQAYLLAANNLRKIIRRILK